MQTVRAEGPKYYNIQRSEAYAPPHRHLIPGQAIVFGEKFRRYRAKG